MEYSFKLLEHNADLGKLVVFFRHVWIFLRVFIELPYRYIEEGCDGWGRLGGKFFATNNNSRMFT